MKRSLKELISYNIEANDGSKGKVVDFLFDEDTWIIRYLMADLGFLTPGKKVLVPRIFLSKPVWGSRSFPVELSKSNLEKCPELEDNKPISRKFEEQLHQHYHIKEYYWSSIHVHPIGAPLFIHPPRPIKAPIRKKGEKDIETSLRSFNEIKNYHIKAIDGELGHVDDLIIDDFNWQIDFIVVDTSNWMPWSKKVLISTEMMDEISYVDQQVNIDLSKEDIKESPEFDPDEPVNEVYEKVLYDFYGRPINIL